MRGSENKGQAGGVDWKGTRKWGVQALGVDQKVRGKLVGWTGNEPENWEGRGGASFQNLKVTSKNIK